MGSGYVLNFSNRTFDDFFLIWRVDGGEGQFASASGYIISNFTLSKVGTVTDSQFGMIFV
jgi:hypothetical protein